jgi:signal transduction histidine kinase
LLDLINEVLDIARIEAGRMSISVEPVHLRGVVEECFELIRPIAGQRSIRLEGGIDPFATGTFWRTASGSSKRS